MSRTPAEPSQAPVDPPVGKKRPVLRYGLLVLGALTALAAGFLGYTILTLPKVSGLRSSNPASTSLIRFRQSEARAAGRALKVRMEWVPFSRVPHLLKESVRITEDFSFYWHKGIDFTELRESLKRDLREGRFARGGSTITQQLAKNLYLSPRKSLFRKLKEALIARRLEKRLSKDRIFELYLNVIELGPGVFGVQAASRRWFHKEVADLDPEEIVRLTAIIPRPLSTDPLGSSRWLRWRCRWILGKLEAYDVVSADEYQALIGEFRSP